MQYQKTPVELRKHDSMDFFSTTLIHTGGQFMKYPLKPTTLSNKQKNTKIIRKKL